MKKLFIALLAALLLAFVACCAAPQQETAAPEPAQSEPASAVSWDDLTFDRTLPLQYATQFSVSLRGRGLYAPHDRRRSNIPHRRRGRARAGRASPRM
ncbi:MAG: hypothetical protein ACLU3I_12075 [Acutalibacteraceae bacterium]